MIKKLNEFNVINKWNSAYDNTKSFDVSQECEKYLHNQKGYLNGCKKCNKITEIEPVLDGIFPIYQIVGNCSQSIYTCKKCNNYIIFDDDKFNLYNNYMKTQFNKEIKKYNL